MNTRSLFTRLLFALTVVFAITAGLLNAQPVTFNDATNDIAGNIATAGGTLDIVKMEVADSVTDVIFTMTVNGNTSTTDWGKFMIGIANMKSTGTQTNNAWSRPIYLNAGPTNGLTHWIGSWLDWGGGANFSAYDDTSGTWNGGTAPGFSSSAGSQSVITYTVPKASLGVTVGDTIYFDAYSSGGGVGDSAIDALANTNISVTDWGGPYTSQTPNIKSYTLNNSASFITNNVTFQVDMSVQAAVSNFVAPQSVRVEYGEGFSNSAALVAGANNIWTNAISIAAVANTAIPYRFVSETPLTTESVARSFGMPTNAVTLSNVFFNNIAGYRDVTFSVDMSAQVTEGFFDPNTQTVEVRGPFNNWAGTLLEQQGTTGIYSGTVTVAGSSSGQTVNYKFFAAGTGAVGYELGGDRSFDLVFNTGGALTPELVLETVPFRYGARNVTFSVDMGVQQALGLFDPATGEVQLRGIGGFEPSDAKTLVRVGDSTVYTGTFLVPGLAGESQQYKFFSQGLNYFVETDPTNTGFEIINQADKNENRQFTLGASGVSVATQTVPQAYFSNQRFGVMGTATLPLPNSSFTPFTSTQGTPSLAQSVPVSGLGLTGNIVATAPLGFEVSSDGVAYGSTANIPAVSGVVSSAALYVRVAASAPYGPISGRVNLTSTDSQNTSLSVSATVEPSLQVRDVTFSVDMSGMIAVGAFNPVGAVVELRGLGGFSTTPVTLDRVGETSVYQKTVSVPGAAGVSTVEYKFYAANAGSNPAAPGWESTSNRTFTVGPAGETQVRPTALFNNVGFRDVTFSVDMSVQIASGAFVPDGGVVEVRGSFNGFAGGTTMTAQSAGIYSVTIPIAGAPGTSLEYKFYAINAGSNPAAPGYESGSNRSFTLGANGEAQILSPVYFSNQAPTRDVTFSVDMSVQISTAAFNPTTGIVQVRGPFNGYLGSPLTREGTTGIYSGTVSVSGAPGATMEYIFWANNSPGAEPETPGWETTGNRTFTLGAANVPQVLSPTPYFSNNSGGETFSSWSDGQPLTPALQIQYAIGGATSPTATNGVPSVTTTTATHLSIRAVVRTNDPTLTVVGQTIGNLSTGQWTTDNVQRTESADPAPEGCQVQIFSTPRGSDGKKFLRLQTSLPAQQP